MTITVAQSGGPTAAINASLAGVIVAGQKSKQITKILGARYGIDGVLSDNFVDLTSLSEADLALLKQTPATALGSCRRKLTDEHYDTILANLKKHDISAFFYIGGNDSMDTVAKLSRLDSDIKFIGIPKTIDNDLPETDHTPGFGSAAKYVATTLKEIARDSFVYDVLSVTIVEIMGRDAGWLTASTCVLQSTGEVHLIYLPERPFSLDAFIEDVRKLHESGQKQVIVAVSEGLRNECGEYAGASAQSGKADAFGHKYLAGVGKFLESQVCERLGCKVRSVELNVSQRCAAHLASEVDLREAQAVAEAGVAAVLEQNANSVMMAIERVNAPNAPYEANYTPVDVILVANRVRKFPEEWINSSGNGIESIANDYFLPLIDGLPKHISL